MLNLHTPLIKITHNQLAKGEKTKLELKKTLLAKRKQNDDQYTHMICELHNFKVDRDTKV